MGNGAFEQSYDLGGVRALIIEDSDLMRDLLQEILRSFGTGHVVTTERAEDALELMENDDFDVVLSDWQLESMDGLTFTQKVRHLSNDTTRRTPIIMCTGHSEKHHVISARDAGVNQFLTKPVSAGELFDKLVSSVWDERPFVISEDYVGPKWSGAEVEKDKSKTSPSDIVDLDFL